VIRPSGTVNTRWRDFGDLFVLTSRHGADGSDLQQALAVVAGRRRAEMAVLWLVLDG